MKRLYILTMLNKRFGRYHKFAFDDLRVALQAVEKRPMLLDRNNLKVRTTELEFIDLGVDNA